MPRDLESSPAQVAPQSSERSDTGARAPVQGADAGDAAVRRIAADAPPAIGSGGVLTRSLTVTGPQGPKVAPEGTYAEIVAVEGTTLTVELGSGFEQLHASIPRDAFHPEPRMGRAGLHHDDLDSYSYMRHTGRLWNGVPKVEDVVQGQIGDCYLMAAMGAVVTEDPQAIVRMFDPPRDGLPSYRIRLYLPKPDGTFIEHWETVDTMLPTENSWHIRNAPARYVATYGQMRNSTSDVAQARWPALVEKAIAQARGGYDTIGAGGQASDAMAMMLGRSGSALAIPSNDQDLLNYFRLAALTHRPVVCSSIHNKQSSAFQAGGFERRPDGSYERYFSANPHGKVPSTLQLLPGTVVITDRKGRAPIARDDGNTQLTGDGVHGAAYYTAGFLQVRYDEGRGPAEAADLNARFEYEGMIDAARSVYADHAYIFERVDEEGRIVLRNPWGDDHPQPLTVPAFRASFETLFSVDAPPAR